MDLILHLDEIFLKGGNRRFFIDRLCSNLKTLFFGCEIKRVEGGLWLMNFDLAESDRLGKIPGIANYAPAFQSTNNIADIKKSVEKLVWANSTARSFRISAVRSCKSYYLSSRELENQLGDYVCQKSGWKVDLSTAELDLHIDVGSKLAWVYGNLSPGAGGLPTGASGPVLCLLSGGIDSPVAAYQMMRRGAEVTLIHFQNQTRVSEEVTQKIFDLAKTLARYQPRVRLLVVPFADWQKQTVMKIPADYRMLVTRRLMLRLAEVWARANGQMALVTGDSLGQVASQTLENLDVVYSVTPLLKLAPLIGFNKSEITRLARAIGTLEISQRPYEDCCSMFVARHPQTRAHLKEVEQMEQGLDLSSLDKTEFISYYFSHS